MNDIKTLTIDELVAHLTKFPHDTKIYMSCGGEGGGFGKLSPSSIKYNKGNKTIVLYPIRVRLEFYEAFPGT